MPPWLKSLWDLLVAVCSGIRILVVPLLSLFSPCCHCISGAYPIWRYFPRNEKLIHESGLQSMKSGPYHGRVIRLVIFDWFVNEGGCLPSTYKIKAMLYDLQLATQRWRIKKLSSCRGGVTRLQIFSQLATRTITNKMADASWNLPRAKDELWSAHSDRIALQVAEGMLHASKLSRNVAKSRGSFFFSNNS